MKICVTTILSIALLLGNSVKLRASVTGPVPSDGDGPATQECQQCCQGPAAIPGIPGLPGPVGQTGPYGQPGSKGDKGELSQKGELGPMGERGAPGYIGSKGQKGEPGETPDDSNQRVAFTVVRTSDFTSSSSGTRLPFEDTETLLSGTSFDLGTGTFICHVPGTHVFMFSIRKFSSSSSVEVHLRKNGDWVVSGYNDVSGNRVQVSGTAVLVLQRGDTVYLTMSGKVHSETNKHWTSFSGFLLYPE